MFFLELLYSIPQDFARLHFLCCLGLSLAKGFRDILLHVGFDVCMKFMKISGVHVWCEEELQCRAKATDFD